MTTTKIQTIEQLEEAVKTSKSGITFDGEFYQAEPVEYPFDAECFGTRAEAEAWIDEEAAKIRARLEVE